MEQKIKKTCKFGHTFFKSSDCTTCPTCEKLKEPASGFLAQLSNPARNSLLHLGIDSIEKLSSFTEKEILKLHGIGKGSLPVFRKSLEENGLTFRRNGEKKLDTSLISSRSILINASPEKIWETLINPTLISQYLFGANTVTDWKTGNEILFIITVDELEFTDRGRVIQNIPRERLEYSYWSGFCGLEDKPENYATVTYEIKKLVDNQSVFSWTQQGFVDEQSRTNSEISLTDIILQIKTLSEKGI